MEQEKTIKLNKINILYIKSILRSEQKQLQAQLEELQEQKTTYITITNILHLQAELEQITNILNKLN